MAINLNDYEDVASLNQWFQGNFPMGSLRILRQEHHIMTDKDGNILDEVFVVQTAAFRDANDLQPASMNVARGRQSEYPKHMARFFAEDVTTSSYGRSIALLKATDKTATKDDMRKVESNPSFKEKLESRQNMYGKAGSKSAQIETILRDSFAADKKEPEPVAWSVGEVVAEIGASIPNEPPACHHGHILKEGISKGGKPYRGYVCKAKQCDAKWAKLTANGKWYFEGGE
jgi:hypothetical protein